MIYHLLTESEPFSEHFGGALSRWTANVLREEDDSMIVCPWADTSWNFASKRLIALSGFRSYLKWAHLLRSHSAIRLRLALLRRVLSPLVNQLKKGDTVYIHNRPEFALALRSRCRRLGIKLLLHMQNSHLSYLPTDYLKQLDVDAFVFCSSFLKSEAVELGVPISQTAVIPNGADEALFFPASNEKPETNRFSLPIALFVGRLVPEKGVHLFIEAMRTLQAKGINVSGKVIGSTGFGDSHESDYLRRLKREKPSNVEFGEYLSGRALAKEFRSANLFCCPSIWNEPFGMVNIEAMATALPVVATAVGGIPEIFAQGGGILVPADSVGELAAAIEVLLKDPQRHTQLSQEGYRSFQKRYRWQEIRYQYRELLDSLGKAA
ncbi:MAG TPA: glycosyltransferase family 4 protein [Candidatus Sulfotelmatobacter sp.]|jgi:spore coat protein SA|nr:glycosyltransferase family 4 protein [Candidatus Sulfotelmatobacter sp.]